MRESFPPQYAVAIKAGLPSGCARAAGYSVSRSGNVFTLAVMNSNAAGVPELTRTRRFRGWIYGDNPPTVGRNR